MTVAQENEVSYSSSIEYLFDECRRIELLLQIAIKKSVKQNNSTNSNFHGLFISDEEVNTIIDGTSELYDKEFNLFIEGLKDRFIKLGEEIIRKKDYSLKNGIFLRLPVLQNIFGLSKFEIDVLIFSLLPDIDKKYGNIYGYLQDDITLKRPTIGFISDILSVSAESRVSIFRYFLQENKLFRYNILKLAGISDNNTSFLSKTLKLDDRILTYLFDINDPDPLIAPFTFLKIPEAQISESRLDPDVKETLLTIMRDYLETKNGKNKLFINLNGPYGSGRKLTAEALCKENKILLLIVDIAEAIKTDLSFDEVIKRIFREGILQPAAIYFENIESLFLEDEKPRTFRKLFFKIADELSWITFFSGDYSILAKEKGLSSNIFMKIEFPILDNSSRKKTWENLLKKEGITLAETELSALSNKFKFSEGQIINAISSARNFQYNNDSGKNLPVEAFYEGCRLQTNHKLSTLAQRIKSNYTWKDIVLPENRLEQLKEISAYIRYRDVVYERWGFNKKMSLGRGLNILFSGPTGTGKTMASGVIANELGLELYKIDLSLVVSKYIGETEKNLSRIFKEAETSNAILFFDEADALFGKRSEIKDAHDRYANIEINYLLQKIEEHEGVVILATNLSKNIDAAFLRRMQFVVEFPFPDERERVMIWKEIFPQNAPLAKDIDYGFLSERLKIAGGNIKNIALTSAFYAAEESSEIGMSHIMLATKREYQKMGKSFLKADLEPYYELTEGK